ncbi:MAG: S-adenosylmethionine:tRNA ribosyltransferase-isomerase [Tidjanibacter sp.]|nr:S-adenosylmethionine:tRNA ribosyltransferase-isomerase [Tidjanibacter sp.]
MQNEKCIKISDYDYPLPDERIAKHPLAERDSSKLLCWRSGDISHTSFSEIGTLLPEGAMLVFNNTRVIRARIIMHKPSGARVEVFCLEPHAPADYERALSSESGCEWCCIVGGLKKWKEGPVVINFDYEGGNYTLNAYRGEQIGNSHVVRFEWDAPLRFGPLLELLGRIPIPPYLNRESCEEDNTRYQTVYSKIEGSVAAPTAGLHFTERVISSLHAQGITTEEVTLHVGAGTFLPVKEDDVTLHTMHTEHFEFSLASLRRLRDALGRIIPVGTTSVRTLESLVALGWRIINGGTPDTERVIGQWELYDIPAEVGGEQILSALIEYMEACGEERLKAATQIMIMPGYHYRLVSGMVTNFHQPKSTLLLLVSAFVGDDWHAIYDYALANGFRFLSYGDSSLLLKKPSNR